MAPVAPGQVQRVVKAEPAVVVVAGPPVETFWAVKTACKVPRQFSTHYTLPVGKILSSKEYDIPYLQSLGVQLESVASRIVVARAIMPTHVV